MGIIIRLIVAAVFIVTGVLACHIGTVYRLPYALKDSGMTPIIKVEHVVRNTKQYYMESFLYKQNDPLKIAETGALLLFVLPGGFLILLGGGILIAPMLRSLMPRKKKKAPPPSKRKAIPVPSAASSHSPASASSADANFNIAELDKIIGGDEEEEQSDEPKRRSFLIPDELMDEDTDKELFHDIEKVVALSQANLSERQMILAVTVLRPQFLPHISQMSDEVKNRLGRQIIQYHVLRLKREEKGISSDQFASQDKRMTELERETICRRYTPRNVGDLPESTRRLVGMVYTLNEQSKVQQSTLSDAEDWQDISLRNFVSVMNKPVPAAG